MARMSEQEFLDACVIPDKTPIICKGEGYTGKLMKPRMVQDGWE